MHMARLVPLSEMCLLAGRAFALSHECAYVCDWISVHGLMMLRLSCLAWGWEERCVTPCVDGVWGSVRVVDDADDEDSKLGFSQKNIRRARLELSPAQA